MSVQRKFMPGSEWIYFKIYCGPTIQQKLLTTCIYELIRYGYQHALIDKAFYVRYEDHSGPHLRLRLHSQYFQAVTALFYKYLHPYVDKRIVANVTMDTYTREIERYGDKHISDVELLFSINSWCILKLFQDTADHWPAGIQLADELLTDAGYDTKSKYELYAALYQSFKQRIADSAANREKLKAIYREQTKTIEKGLMMPSGNSMAGAQQVAISAIMAGTSGDRIVKDLIHMLFNRLFIKEQNLHEMVIYYMMHKFYRSANIIGNAKMAEDL